MAITYVGGQVGGRAGATSTTNITFALTGGSDTTPQAGDFVVIGCTVASQARTPACAISGYSAETQINANGTTYDTSLNMSWKFMGLTPDTTFTLPSTGNIADAQRYTVQVWRGVDPTNPFDVARVAASGTGTGRPNPGSITPTTSGAVVGIIGAGAAATGAAYTAPANYTTGFLTGSTADTNDAMIGSGYRSWTSGAEDPAQYTGGTTNAADSWAAFTYALRPEVSYLPTYISGETITLGQTATPGAQNVTVPSDAQVVVVHFSCYSATACALSLTSNFAGTFTLVQDAGIDEQGGVAFAVVSSTGAKTITPSWSGTPTEGPLFFVSYIKDVDTAASFVRAIKNQVREDTGSTAATVDLASRSTDLVLALDKNFNASETPPSNPTGWTSRLTLGNVDEGGRVRSLDSPSDGKNTITGQTNTYSAIMAIAVRGVASAPITYQALTGAQVTASAGAVTASQAVAKALTGAQVTAAAGTLSASQAVAKALTGAQVTASAGAVTASQSTGDITEALTGTQVTAAAGTLSASQAVAKALTGAQVTASAGTVTASQAVAKALTGAQVTAAAGTVTASQSTGDITEALTGTQVTAAAGTVTASQAVTKALTGAQAAAAAGTVTASQAVAKALTGAQVTAAAGTLSASQAVTKALTGVQATAAAGTLSASQAVVKALTGTQVTAAAGIITASQAVAKALTSAQVTAVAGIITASQNTSDVDVALGGTQVTSLTGTIASDQQIVRALLGTQVLAHSGVLNASVQQTTSLVLSLSGSRVTAIAGRLTVAPASQYPSPANVAVGVKYGPTGVEFTGTMMSAGYNRGRVLNE